ncbi:hypothetical protein PHAVU_005G011600 [Phaseolus vulgaris]|uniref:ABSCISIC ACID-INSENSITIVE 5-like protein 3 n=1 Tax=Phaseolus vulgaris TaxID=3885 RepID=UPI0035CA51B2
MGSQGGGDNNEKHSLHHSLVRKNSLYGLTLNEVQNQLGDTGKPLSSMNIDELLKIVNTAEANQSTIVASFSLTSSLSKKTVDEVWRDIQGSKDSKQNKCQETQPTLGEMTLEDFLVKAGVVVEPSSTAVVDPNVVTPQFPQHGPWMQYPQAQYQLSQQGLMGIYMTSQNITQSLHTQGNVTSDGEVALSSHVMGSLTNTRRHGRKRGTSEDIVDKTFDRRQKRMIKNRESAARSRARKQAYTIELEHKVLRLEEENEKLRRQKEVENILSSVPPQKPRYRIHRSASASF